MPGSALGGKIGAVCIFALMAASSLYARDIVVDEERISISPPDEEGYAVVSAPPHAVLLGPNIVATFVIENTKSKPSERVQGSVNPDGSFSARIRAARGDKLKIRFSTSTNEKKKLSRKVPAAAAPERVQPPLKPASKPTPKLVIRYKGLSAKGDGNRDIESEVLRSGVLPPD